MPALLLAFALFTSGKLEISEETIAVKLPKITEKPDVAVQEAIEVIKKPASDAALHEAAQVCALLSTDVSRVLAAAKAGPADTLDARLLTIADVYLGLGDWAPAERTLRATRPSARVNERLGHAMRAQNRPADAAKAYLAAVNTGTGAELEQIIDRVAPVMTDWVLDFENGHVAVMRTSAKAVLTAMLPHQAGEGSERTKGQLARLEAAPDKSFRSTLTTARLEAALAVQVPALRTCFARALVQQPELKGQLELKFTAEPGGQLTSLTTASNTTGVKTLATCFEQRIKALNLVTDTQADVTMPFVLTPL